MHDSQHSTALSTALILVIFKTMIIEDTLFRFSKLEAPRTKVMSSKTKSQKLQHYDLGLPYI